jgi:hypothetical protein
MNEAHVHEEIGHESHDTLRLRRLLCVELRVWDLEEELRSKAR